MTKEQEQIMQGLPLITLYHATTAEHVPEITRGGLKPSDDGYVYFALSPKLCEIWLYHRKRRNRYLNANGKHVLYVFPVTFTRAEFSRFECFEPPFDEYYHKYKNKLPPRKDCESFFQYLSAWRFKGGIPKEKIMQDLVIRYEC